jgi:hypothetical protein
METSHTSECLKCPEVRADLSALADEALDAERSLRLRRHLDACRACAVEWRQLVHLKKVLRVVHRVTPPPDLALALRVRLSQQTHSHFANQLMVRLRNLMEPVAIPAVAGLCSALVLFGILIHSLAIPTLAFTDDVPLRLSTGPRLKSMAPFSFSAGEPGLFVEIYVDKQGDVADFRVLNGPHDPALIAKLRNFLLFTRFDPATSFGRPRNGTAIFNFSSVLVKG